MKARRCLCDLKAGDHAFHIRSGQIVKIESTADNALHYRGESVNGMVRLDGTAERVLTILEDSMQVMRGRRWTVLASHHEENQFPVFFMRSGKTLAVSYGAEFHTWDGLHYDIEALREYGHCVSHAMHCNGLFETEEAA